ncbi:alpha/beta hydrolase [Virgibacillus sediminis]|uniref:Alpha/beta hydrolase n=1 Tax=Virgibacillus sediminis TaxID=202260 RepID=A0ABV7A2R0_9BACI
MKKQVIILETEYWQLMSDKTEVYTKKWHQPGTEPKAIVQLAHGMVEHINRYNEFAEYLLDQGIFVYGNDHRGHGKTAVKQGKFGYFAEKDGFARVTRDLIEITERIRQDHPAVPIFLLGHSMGSFMVRRYIQSESKELSGAIMMGTGYYSNILSRFGRGISSILPRDQESAFMHELVFGFNNRRIAQKVTSFDWLSSDPEEVQAFLDDPYTDFIPTGSFFHDLMTGISEIHNRQKLNAVRSDLPLLFISGAQDPVGAYEKGIWKTARLYLKAGVQDITAMLFPEGRHEILHEVNKEEVFEQIYAWIHHRIK